MSDLAISASDLHRCFGTVVALDGLSFEVSTGKVVGLLGPNGSGKTTTIAILSTALHPDSGRATVGGLDVVKDAAAVRAAIGFAGQYAAADANLTGRENLSLIGRLSRVPRRAARQRAEELLVRFGLSEAADRLVRGYSGGMRRRLDLAAALVHRPPILFLDEPTTGLDPESRFHLWDMVRDLVNDGTTVLLTTQYLEEADALADEIVMIDRGRAVETGTPAVLKARVGTAVIELMFANTRDARRAERVLAAKFTPERSDNTLRLQSAEGSAAGVPVMFLLVFSSSAFVPLETMPGWLQAFGARQPLTALVDAERALVLGGPAASHVLASLAWSLGLLVAFVVLAARAYRRLGR